MTPSQVAREVVDKWDGLPINEYYPRKSKTLLIESVALALTQAISQERERICRVVHEEFYHEIPEQQLLDAIRKPNNLSRQSEKEK